MTEPGWEAQQPRWHQRPGQRGGEDRQPPVSAGGAGEKALAAARLQAGPAASSRVLRELSLRSGGCWAQGCTAALIQL